MRTCRGSCTTGGTSTQQLPCLIVALCTLSGILASQAGVRASVAARCLLYHRFDPLWNSLIVGGFYDDKPFLGTIGMIGTNYTDTHVATGFGNHLARPIFRERFTPDMDEATATQMLHDALKVCYYRDKQSINKFQVAKVTKEGTTISEPFSLEMKWDYKVWISILFCMLVALFRLPMLSHTLRCTSLRTWCVDLGIVLTRCWCVTALREPGPECSWDLVVYMTGRSTGVRCHGDNKGNTVFERTQFCIVPNV